MLKNKVIALNMEREYTLQDFPNRKRYNPFLYISMVAAWVEMVRFSFKNNWAENFKRNIFIFNSGKRLGHAVTALHLASPDDIFPLFLYINKKLENKISPRNYEYLAFLAIRRVKQLDIVLLYNLIKNPTYDINHDALKKTNYMKTHLRPKFERVKPYHLYLKLRGPKLDSRGREDLNKIALGVADETETEMALATIENPTIYQFRTALTYASSKNIHSIFGRIPKDQVIPAHRQLALKRTDRFYMEKLLVHFDTLYDGTIANSTIFPKYEQYKDDIKDLFKNDINSEILIFKDALKKNQIINLSNIGVPHSLILLLQLSAEKEFEHVYHKKVRDIDDTRNLLKELYRISINDNKLGKRIEIIENLIANYLVYKDLGYEVLVKEVCGTFTKDIKIRHERMVQDTPTGSPDQILHQGRDDARPDYKEVDYEYSKEAVNVLKLKRTRHFYKDKLDAFLDTLPPELKKEAIKIVSRLDGIEFASEVREDVWEGIDHINSIHSR